MRNCTSLLAIFGIFAFGTLALSNGATFGSVFGTSSSLAKEFGLPDSIDIQLIQDFIDHKEEIKLWLNQAERGRGELMASLTCSACRAAIGLALSAVHEGGTPEFVGDSLAKLCTDLQIMPQHICEGAVDNYLPAAHYILTERSNLNTNDICSIIIQNGDCGEQNETLTQWHIKLDEQNKPPVVSSPLLPIDQPTVRVLHLTDIHLDLNYVDGSVGDCGLPLCCRDPPQDGNSTLRQAGHFGDYSCDFPLNALDDLFNDAFNRYDNYSFVMLTGDYVHHAVWATSVQENTKHNKAVAQSLKSSFKDGTRIFPVVGNHEPHPCNLFIPSSVWGTNSSNGELFDNSWIYKNLAELYEDYLPPHAIETFKKAGYYTVTPEPGLRLVVLNTNFCYTLNFWIFYNSQDPEGQLQWFADTMVAAEEAGDIVYIVGHVPPGHYQCWSHWNVEFNRVINRFENIIQGQFYGHTHEDDLKVFFEDSTGEDGVEARPTSSLYIGASATTYTNLNPGYKVYFVDGAEQTKNKTWEILDHETIIYNVTQANLLDPVKGKPQWFQLYSARKAYGLPSLRPKDLYDFVVRMVNDEKLFQSWYSHYNKAADTMEPCEDSKCRLSYLCDIVTTDIKDQSHCEHLKSLLKE